MPASVMLDKRMIRGYNIDGMRDAGTHATSRMRRPVMTADPMPVRPDWFAEKV